MFHVNCTRYWEFIQWTFRLILTQAVSTVILLQSKEFPCRTFCWGCSQFKREWKISISGQSSIPMNYSSLRWKVNVRREIFSKLLKQIWAFHLSQRVESLRGCSGESESSRSLVYHQRNANSLKCGTLFSVNKAQQATRLQYIVSSHTYTIVAWSKTFANDAHM